MKGYLDGTLSFRRSCAHGICGSDAMRINGRNRLACKVLVHDLRASKITVEPILGLPVIKDLIVDMEPFFEHYRSVLPYFDQRRAGAGNRSACRARRSASASTTPPSASCAPAAPPPARPSGPTSEYVGPAAIVAAHRFIFDSRDQAGGRAPEDPERASSACTAATPSSTAPRPARARSRSPRPSARSRRRLRRGRLIRNKQTDRTAEVPQCGRFI